MVKLDKCDVLLFVSYKNGPVHWLSRWAIGKYEHVAMYLGELIGVPMVYESRGRGVYIASLLPQIGRPVAVFRPLISDAYKQSLVNTGFEIAADEKSFFDYSSVVTSILPRVISEKLPWLPLPMKYHRDIFLMCSEAVAEVFWRNGIMVIPDDEIPLPGDFAISSYLWYVDEGNIMQDVVP